MKPTPSLHSFLMGSVLLAAFPTLHAAALYWDGADTTADANSSEGTWTTMDAWDTASTAGSNATWTTGSQAVFGGTVAGTVLLDSGITINNLVSPATIANNFAKTGYLIDAASAQTITLGNASVLSGNGWTFNPNVNFDNAGFNLTTSIGSSSEIKGVITGAGLFVKGGGGETVLSGSTPTPENQHQPGHHDGPTLFSPPLRSGHRLSQRPSPQKQVPSNNQAEIPASAAAPGTKLFGRLKAATNP